MGRAKYQVLVIPYCKTEERILYCILKRSDMADCWQFVAGGGEDEDASPMISAKREALEEAGVPMDLPMAQLDSTCSISTEHFPKARVLWGEDCFVIPEYSFAVELPQQSILLSDEHTDFAWVDYDTAQQKLQYDSNRVALWELDQKIKMGAI